MDKAKETFRRTMSAGNLFEMQQDKKKSSFVGTIVDQFPPKEYEHPFFPLPSHIWMVIMNFLPANNTKEFDSITSSAWRRRSKQRRKKNVLHQRFQPMFLHWVMQRECTSLRSPSMSHTLFDKQRFRISKKVSREDFQSLPQTFLISKIHRIQLQLNLPLRLHHLQLLHLLHLFLLLHLVHNLHPLRLPMQLWFTLQRVSS